MKKTAIALLLVASGWLSAAAANATTFQDAASLPGGWTVFQNFESPVVANYAPAASAFPNMTFAATGSVPNLYVTADYSPYITNMSGQSIVNFDLSYALPPTSSSVTFSTPLTSLAFSFMGEAIPITLTAFNGITSMATITTTGTGDGLVYGFSGFTFNKVQISTAGYYAMDNFASVAAIPEPGTWAMMLAGLGLMGFVARRRRQLQEAANTVA